MPAAGASAGSYRPNNTPRGFGAVHDTLVVQAPTPLQKGAEHLLRLPDAIFKDIHKPFLQKRDLLLNALQSIGFKITPPDGSYYLFADYRSVPTLCDMNATDAAMYMTREIGCHPRTRRQLLRNGQRR